MSGDPFLRVRDLARDFELSSPWFARLVARTPKSVLRAVREVSFDVRRGQTFALVGESGSGKTTVARMVVGLLPATAGTVEVDGLPMTTHAAPALRRRLHMIFQDPYASLNPRWRVHDIVAEPLHAFGLVADAGAARTRVVQLLEQVGLGATDAAKYPHMFSGGQRQRVAIARALATGAELLVADEPTSALDVSVQAQILNLLKALQREHRLTYLLISHDLAIVRHMADSLAVMYLGAIVEMGPAAAIFAAPRHPYTRMLLAAVPGLHRRHGKDRPEGEIASPLTPPSGCAFHPRCRLADARCRLERPLLEDGVACHAVAEGRAVADARPAALPESA